MASLQETMSNVSLDDITVTPDGKVQIANPSVAASISALKSIAPLRAQADNGSGCTNGSQCRSLHAV